MKKKRFISALLLACILLPLFAGCARQFWDAGQYDIALNTGLEGDSYYYIDRDYAIDSTQVEATEAEYAKAEAYIKEQILESSDANTLGFDFAVDGKLFSEVFTEYERNVEEVASDDIMTEWEVTYKKPGEVLEVSIKAVLYKVAPVCEWTVWIENTGDANSGIITDFSGYKATIGNAGNNVYDVLGWGGGRDATVSFKPEVRHFTDGRAIEFNGSNGRPSVRWAPYYNVYWENEEASWGKEGIFFSVGWTGQWKSSLTQTENGVEIDTRQEYLETYLKPGESIRSARMTLLFWEKDITRAQNIWTRFLYNYIQPKEDGETLETRQQMNNNVYVTNLMEDATTDNQVIGIKLRLANGLPFDSWQMDAGWSVLFGGNWWSSVGNWTPDPERFGESLKGISDVAHEYGIETVLWYEPERIANYTDWKEEFMDKGWLIYSEAQSCIDLANDEVLDYLCNFMKNSLEINGVDWYRQDCNFDLLPYWKIRDAETEGENRTGITENKYIVNYYKYYDFLIEECGVMIDSCASGGKRLDLETQSRSYPLWRDDNCNDPIVTQCQTYGINMFAPYSGQSTVETSSASMKYVSRSNFMQCTNFVYNIESGDQALIASAKNVMEEHVKYSPYFLGDYYPLTEWSDTAEKWIGWQWHLRDENTGIIQMFKRQGSTQTSQLCYLSGLEKDTVYVLTDIDTGDRIELTGYQLMTSGITIHIDSLQDAKIIEYAPKA